VTRPPDDPAARHLRVVRGEPTEEEVAALVTALSLVAARAAAERAAAARRTTVRSLWALPVRNIRPPLGPRPGAWRASGFPR
jgi:Acyl-CoA carboxylase epsilon subunit